MSRLQDFPSVTPTASDNILIVQSDGQGLASVGSTLGAKMDKSNPTGTGTLSIGRKENTTTGTYSVAIGRDVEASGTCSLAEGRETKATINQAHAEGYQTEASGNSSHAEGSGTKSSGNYSHSEGQNTIASGPRSHVEGYYTEANRRSQHVFGEYNVADTSGGSEAVKGEYIEIVGNGANDANRSNARTLDWNGNETIAGTLTQSSDARLKEVNAEDIPDVSDIKAIRFNWKKNIGRDFSEHIGYLAQDVEKVLPFLVKEDAEGHKTLDYIAFLVAKIDSLEKRISELEKGE